MAGADLQSKLRPPPSGPVPWRIIRLGKVSNPDKPLIVAKDWYLARAVAMLTCHVEYHEVEVELVKEAKSA